MYHSPIIRKVLDVELQGQTRLASVRGRIPADRDIFRNVRRAARAAVQARSDVRAFRRSRARGRWNHVRRRTASVLHGHCAPQSRSGVVIRQT